MENREDLSGMAPRNSVEQEEGSTLMHFPATERNPPTDWTNEKHSLYLDSMEATFVNQLHKSIDLFGWHTQDNCPSQSKLAKHEQNGTSATSGKFKVFRNGYWSKINFKRDEPEVNQEEESRVVLENPWIQHYKFSEKRAIRKSAASSAKASLAKTTTTQFNTHNFQLWRQDPVDRNTEVTAQNFYEEDLEEEKSEIPHEMKRIKTSSDVVTSNDQVVPSGNCSRN